MGPKRSVLIITGVLFAALVFLAGYVDAFAADGSCPKSVSFGAGADKGAIGKFVTDLLEVFKCQPGTWTETLRTMASRLFWLLVSIELSWTAISMALRGSELGEWLNTIVNKIFFIGFFGALLQFSSEWAGAIVSSFQQAGDVAGSAASGVPLKLSDPGTIFDLAVNSAENLLTSPAGQGWFTVAKNTITGDFTGLALIVTAFIVLMVFVGIGVNMFITLVESYVVIAACVLMTGFGGSRWTKDYAMKILTYALSVGAKLFMMELIVSLGMSIVKNFTDRINVENFPANESKISLALAIIGVGIVFYQVSKSIPEFVQGLLNGTAPTSGGEKAIAGMMPSPWGVAKGGAALGVSASMATYQVGRAASQGFRTSTGELDLSAKGVGLGTLRLGGVLLKSAFMTAHNRMTWGINPGFGTRIGQWSNTLKTDTDKKQASAKAQATVVRGGQLATAIQMASRPDNDVAKKEYMRKLDEQIKKDKKQTEAEQASGQPTTQSKSEKARADLQPLSAQELQAMTTTLQTNTDFSKHVQNFMTRVEQFQTSSGSYTPEQWVEKVAEMQKIANELASGDSRTKAHQKEQDMVAKWAQKQVTEARRGNLPNRKWFSGAKKDTPEGGKS